jgi:antitoxin component of MazEF toxin-antitoxin module
MKRKLIKIGNSIAVTLPGDMVKELSLEPGMEVETTVDPRDGSFVVRAGTKYFEKGELTPRFKKLTEGLIRERRELYKKLS